MRRIDTATRMAHWVVDYEREHMRRRQFRDVARGIAWGLLAVVTRPAARIYQKAHLRKNFYLD